ncbi:MAG: beta-galactosidase [Actinobacteria bacterium]|nr:beta-galactosidase [Actinomycetota bacterium]MCG2802473.1 beta-galactosidase [Cellulomonas sp.]
MSAFTVGEHDFLADGQPVRLLSGALHYPRIHPGAWRDRVVKARQMGLNTIETYVFWNEHAPQPGTFVTDGRLDLVRFLQIVGEEGMHAIVRPGPYVCAEWDNGGLPAWLTADPAVGLRRAEPRYLAAVDAYLRTVYELIAPLQVDRGGPVVLVQVENEYGAYGADQDYLHHLVDLTRECGITVPLTTVDQPDPVMLDRGSLPELLRTASFGTRATERLATLRAHQSTGPLMCAEFWCGWFDHWGAEHHVTDVEASARELDDLLTAGASVNIYMLHGGTSFGLTSGANDKGVYQPTVTSYDYDAPLDEAGRPTAKYWRFREVIARHAPVGDDVPAPAAPAPAFEVPLVPAAGLRDAAEATATWLTHDNDRPAPPTLDELAHWRGLVLQRAQVAPAGHRRVLELGEVRDRVAVWFAGAPVGVLARDHHDRALVLPAGGGELLLLVEDQGRVNYGPRLGEPKGVLGPVRLDGVAVTGWSSLVVDHDLLAARVLEAPAAADDAPAARLPAVLAGPTLARARFALDGPSDLFLDTRDWGRGMAWVNGWPLGRYWSRGPQHTLYVPGPATRTGSNDLVVLETTGARPVARFVPHPDLGHTEA